MSLILVVDPDSRHAAHVASMARKHLKAEFVTADSGFRALEVLADRVPDIVLTAALLPRRDEIVLSDYLRALGDAAAHVQTLTIPILSGGSIPARGVRGRFRRDRPAPASEGCDPELFAEQVGQYLHRAHQTRRLGVAEDVAIEADPPEDVRRPGAAECVSMEADSVRRPGAAECVSMEADPVRRPGAADGDVMEADPAPQDIDLTPFLEALAEPELPPAPAPVDLQVRPLPAINLAQRIAALPPARVIEAEVVEPPDPPRVRPYSAESGLRVRRADAAEGQSIRGGSAVRRTDAAEGQPIRGGSAVRTTDAAEGQPIRGGSAAPAPTQHLITLPAMLGDPATGQTQTAVNVAVAVSVQVATQTMSATTPKKRTKPKPIQDEWGFFDPDQCGFKALLSRLDAIAESEDDE